MDHEQLIDNVVRVAERAMTYGLPTVLSTVNVSTGANEARTATVASFRKLVFGPRDT
jgi:DhnA family fructose-bisphosphate aldolase class Ia